MKHLNGWFAIRFGLDKCSWTGVVACKKVKQINTNMSLLTYTLINRFFQVVIVIVILFVTRIIITTV